MIDYFFKKPSIEEYSHLRDSVGWNLTEEGISFARAEDSLIRSPLCVCAYHQSSIVGMARITGDLSMFGYIQDVIVNPNYQKKGIGRNLLKLLIGELNKNKGYLIGVCPSKKAVLLYEEFGFKKRPEDPNGFMTLKI